MRATLGNCGEHDLIMLLRFDLPGIQPGAVGTWMDLLRESGHDVMPPETTPVVKIRPHLRGCAHCKRIGWFVQLTPQGTLMIRGCEQCFAYATAADAALAAVNEGVPCDPGAGIILHHGTGRVVRLPAPVPATQERHITVLPGTTALTQQRLYLEVNLTDLVGEPINGDVNAKILDRLVGWRPFGRRREVLVQEVRIIQPPVPAPPSPPSPKPQPAKHTRSIQIDSP